MKLIQFAPTEESQSLFPPMNFIWWLFQRGLIVFKIKSEFSNKYKR